MKRPDDLIESLEAAAKRASSNIFGGHYPLTLATSKNILALICYVKVLEKALEIGDEAIGWALNDSALGYQENWRSMAERELFPDAPQT